MARIGNGDSAGLDTRSIGNKTTEIVTVRGGVSATYDTLKKIYDWVVGIQSDTNAALQPSALLDSIKTVDGSGSGLDADTVDGIQISQILRSDVANQSTLGNFTVSGQIVARLTTPNTGYASLRPGANDRAGYVEFVNPDGTRKGLIGAGTNIAKIPISSVAGTHYDFTDGDGPRIGNNVIWHAGNDGAGSGLDSDTIDGLQASQLLRSDTNGTITGALSISGSANARILRLYSNADTYVEWYRNGDTATRAGYIQSTAGGLRLSPEGLTFDLQKDGNAVWSGTYFTVFAGGNNNAHVKLVSANGNSREVYNDNTNIGFLGTDLQWVFRINDSGAIITRQLGDLKSYIDTAANNASNTIKGYSEIGSYILAACINTDVSTAYAPGFIVPGSVLRPAGFRFSNVSGTNDMRDALGHRGLTGTGSGTLPGSWRLMGFQAVSQGMIDLYVRVA